MSGCAVEKISMINIYWYTYYLDETHWIASLSTRVATGTNYLSTLVI